MKFKALSSRNAKAGLLHRVFRLLHAFFARAKCDRVSHFLLKSFPRARRRAARVLPLEISRAPCGAGVAFLVLRFGFWACGSGLALGYGVLRFGFCGLSLGFGVRILRFGLCALGFGFCGSGFGVWGLNFWGSGFAVWGLGFEILGFDVRGLRFAVWGMKIGVRIWGSGFGVSNLGFENWGSNLGFGVAVWGLGCLGSGVLPASPGARPAAPSAV